MAPNLAQAAHEQLEYMVTSEQYADNEIARTTRCSQRTIRRVRSHLRHFGTTKAPPNASGRPKSITPAMLSALFDRLLEKPGMYQDEMAVFLWDEFETLVTMSSIGRALRAAGWTKKVIRRIAEEQNADLTSIPAWRATLRAEPKYGYFTFDIDSRRSTFHGGIAQTHALTDAAISTSSGADAPRTPVQQTDAVWRLCQAQSASASGSFV